MGGGNTKRNPFSAGRWVTGAQFFGREQLIDRLLHSNESCDWVIGKRRVGKTSLLRQIESIINERHEDHFAVFWDVQGSYDGKGLDENFHDAIEDSRDNFPEKWELLGDIDFERAPSYQAIKKWARCAQRHNLQCYLLIDEAEEFINIGTQDGLLLGKLRKTLQGHGNLHTVISSTPRLEQFHKTIQTETSPFLHGFHVHYLGHFSADAALSLLRQGIDSDAVCESIYQYTDGNPFEMQLFAKHYFEEPHFDKIALQLVANPSLVQEIEVNFELLSLQDQDILKEVFQGRNKLTDFLGANDRAQVSKLSSLGYLVSPSPGHLRLGSQFMAQWMADKFALSPCFHAQRQEDEWVERRHSIKIQQQLLSFYKIFLEFAADGKRLANFTECFRISSQDGFVYPDKAVLRLEPESRNFPEWCLAVLELQQFMRHFCDVESNWVLFRFHQMASDGPLSYSEGEFLDLMALIAEESLLSE